MMIDGSANSMCGYLAQSLNAKSAATKPAFNVSGARTAIRDEYIPSGISSAVKTSTAAVSKPVDAASVDMAMETVMELVGLSREDYFNFALAIDKNGRFHSGGGIVKQNAYNWDTQEQGKLGAVIDGLNQATVNGQSLATVMLEQFAEETGMNLGAERKKDSFYYTCVVYNGKSSEAAVNPDAPAGMVSDSFATIIRQRAASDYSYYEREDVPRHGADGYDNNLKALSDWQFFDYEFNDLEAPWNRYKVADDSSDGSRVTNSSVAGPDRSVSVNLSFMTEQAAASPVSEMIRDLNRLLLQGTITRVLEANGVELEEGDTISMMLNGKGELSISADDSRIGGAAGDEIGGLCSTLENALNQTKTKDGRSLGEALLEQFAQEMGFNPADMANDENFSISFSFKYNSETGINEIVGARRVQLDTQLSAQCENDADDRFMPDVPRYQPTLESEIGIDLNAAPLFSLDLYSQEKIDAASLHKNPIAWALGLDAVDSPLTLGISKSQLTDKVKATAEGLDEKIAAALKSSNITLGADEKLKLSVNNKGEVTVAESGIGKTRAEEIQKALNQDSSIGQAMLLSHAQRSVMNTGVKSNAADSNSTAILFDQLLQREYGVSLSDFSRNTNHSDQYGVKNYSISSESGGEELVARLFDNERALYHKIESYVGQMHDDPNSANFEYGFSYSNGILVENGQTDASGMKEQARDILHRAMLVDSADFSVELDAEGNYIRSNVNQVQGADSNYARQLNQRLTSYFARPEGWLNNMTTGANGVTKLFSFDSMRLLQYNLGEDAKELTDFKAVIAGSIK